MSAGGGMGGQRPGGSFGSTSSFNPYGGMRKGGMPGSSSFGQRPGAPGQSTGGNMFVNEQPPQGFQRQGQPFQGGQMPNANPMAAFNRFDGHQAALDSLRGQQSYGTKPFAIPGGDPLSMLNDARGAMGPTGMGGGSYSAGGDPAYARQQQNAARLAASGTRPDAPNPYTDPRGDGMPRPDLGQMQPGQYGWQASTLGTTPAFDPGARSFINHFAGNPWFQGLDQNNLLAAIQQQSGVQFDPNDPRWAQAGSQYYPGR
jgi:hypothetical protein